MAVTITATELASALRLGSSPEEASEAARLLLYVTEAIQRHAPAAGDAVANEAAIRLAGFLFDQPNAGRGAAYANAMRSSGAARILLPYVAHGAGAATAATTAAAQKDSMPVETVNNIFLAATAPPASRNPGKDPNGTGFIRRIGLSGYSPVTQDDIDQANPAGGVISTLARWRGGNHGNTSISRDNSLNLQSGVWIGYRYTVPAFLFVLLGEADAENLFVESVSQNGVDIPGARQTGTVQVIGRSQAVWVSDRAYSQAEIDAGEIMLHIASTGPATFNRYITVTQSPVPTVDNFIADGAQTGASSTVRVPNTGARGGQGYIHIAMPADQPDPRVIGEVGEPNLRAHFRSGDNVEINGDAMQTLSTTALVYIPRGAPLWIIE